MTFKQALKSIFQRLYAKNLSPSYPSFDVALEDSDSYQDSRIIDVVVRKTKYHKNNLKSSGMRIENQQLLQNLLVLSFAYRRHALNILDYGGACGATFFELDHFMPYAINRWFVVETPAMTSAGKKCFQNEKLLFYNNLQEVLSECKSIDIIIAQGVLQFVENPLVTIAELLGIGADYLYVSRTIFGENISHSIITKHTVNLSLHGPGKLEDCSDNKQISLPRTLISYDAFWSCIPSTYRVIYSFSEGPKKTVTLEQGQVIIQHSGFLLENTIRINRNK